ncbi:MAG: hypothetical protein C5B46_07110 [Proteobacteria bacterium]|nr:MAG: hypothetical protein C5B46_07110 [Pseudomonadota bacterium]
MRNTVRDLILGAALILAAAVSGCGRQSDTTSGHAQQGRLYDSQRAVLEKAKTVNDTVFQTDTARREQEQRESQ